MNPIIKYGLDVNPDYALAVNHFGLEAKGSNGPVFIRYDDFVLLIRRIALRIIYTNDLKEKVSHDGNHKKLTLSEACYVVSQYQDRDNGAEIFCLMNAATKEEVQIVNRAVVELSESVKLDIDDLRTATILFGIKRIHEIAGKESLLISNPIPKFPNPIPIGIIQNLLTTLLKTKQQNPIDFCEILEEKQINKKYKKISGLNNLLDKHINICKYVLLENQKQYKEPMENKEGY